MLRDVVAHFLDSLTEREFDAPMLAILASRGFTDTHFIHGGFEFGKDVIAKRVDVDGVTRQYAIQSKAGDIGTGSWREIRPQIEEAAYNPIGHPHFDEELPRVAVLLTTGRLKGGAPTDVQAWAKSLGRYGNVKFELWDRERLLDWLCLDPALGLAGSRQTELLSLAARVQQGDINEPDLERYTRDWLASEADATEVVQRRAAIEAAVISSLLREERRLDLAAAVALHLLRSSWAHATPLQNGASRPPLAASALRLFVGYVEELLTQVRPLLDDPMALLRSVADVLSIVTYPAFAVRLIELLALLAYATEDESPAVHGAAVDAVMQLAARHPGAIRLVSDSFATSLIAPVLLMHTRDRPAANSYMVRVSEWLLDRYDQSRTGLGLGSLDESEEVAVERLLGGALDFTKVNPRQQSYAATVLMDLCHATGATALRDSLRSNYSAVRLFPTGTSADESVAHWRRGGVGVWPEPRGRRLSLSPAGMPKLDLLLLTSAMRSRHDAQLLETMCSR